MKRYCLLSAAAIVLAAQPVLAAPLSTDAEQHSRTVNTFVQVAQNQNQNQNNNQSGN